LRMVKSGLAFSISAMVSAFPLLMALCTGVLPNEFVELMSAPRRINSAVIHARPLTVARCNGVARLLAVLRLMSSGLASRIDFRLAR